MINQASLNILFAAIPALCLAAGCKGTSWPGYQSFGKTPTFVASVAELASADSALKVAAETASPPRQSSDLSSGSPTRPQGSSEPGCSSGCCGGS